MYMHSHKLQYEHGRGSLSRANRANPLEVEPMPRSKSIPIRQPIYVIGPSIAYIPLTQGQFALVDWEDAARIAKYDWFAYFDKSCGFYYAKRRVPGPEPRQIMSMHAFILGLYKSGMTADHIYPGNGLDNRKANLRPATASQQVHNRGGRRHSKSGLKGASWHKQNQYWTASIHINGRLKHIGCFATPEEAHAAYCAKAKELHGEFARLS